VIRAVVSDFGGVLTAPLMLGFARIQGDTGVPSEAFGTALARATAAAGRNPLYELEVGAITEGEFLARMERELTSILGRPVSLHGFGARYMAALEPNEALFAHYRRLHEAGMRLALLTNNVREWEPLWRTRLPIDEIFETVVDSAFVGLRKPDPAIYALVLERLGLPASACVFVDDLAVNIEAAHALGFAVVHHRETERTIAELDALVEPAESGPEREGDESRDAIETRPERAGDEKAIARVHAAAFPPEDPATTLTDELRAAGDLVPELCFVALRDGELVGHVAVSRATLDGAEALALGPIGVLPAHQRAGVGAALMRATLDAAAATDWPLIALVGHADYYPRFGFEAAGPLGVVPPFEVEPQYWMAYRLPGYRPELRGVFRFADAFPEA
jgi:putative hydrolase of the HAD superfamily